MTDILTKETNLLYYKRYKNKATATDYLKWANSLAEADVDSITLYKILSMNCNESLFSFEEYFNKFVLEIEMSIPIYEECARTYLYYLCQEILSDSRNAYINLVSELDYPEDLITWVNISEDIDRIIYDDQYHKPNKVEVRQQIILEAKKHLAKVDAIVG
ncbi:hypothetical protein [Paenibacillus sp. PDC88]|uniref:hypothetical protein n=1 Tax=Paenibacillus sp. PDC88 TaxID=1884375 RepID=UPI00089B812F|nr:hypothetical protein [Paenibacillus sp. PDC88]SDW37229.1 hypothetical protein SAMN05518848_1011189 [Paenibacillus sp. PDC88]